MEVTLGYRGLIVKAATFHHLRAKRPKMFADLTVRQKSYTRTIYNNLWRAGGDGTVAIPRHCVTRLQDAGLVRVVHREWLPHPIVAPIELIYELKPEQQQVIDHLMGSIYTQERAWGGTAAATLNMKAGTGKTYLAAGLIAELGLKTLYVVPRVALATQTLDVLRAGLVGPTVAYTASSVDFEAATADIVIVVVNTLAKVGDDAIRRYGLVIFDEVHMLCGTERRQIFWRAQCEYALGMSATTEDRVDGLDAIYHRTLGPPIYAADIAVFPAVEFTGEVRIVKYSGPPEYTAPIYNAATGTISFPDMVSQLTRDPERNNLIVRHALDLYGANRNIFVFTESRDHIDALSGLLRAAGVDDSAILRGGVSETAAADAAAVGKIILTTYGYSSVGISIPRLDSAIWATPRKTGFKQICARVMRRGGDVSIHRVFIDILDVNTTLRTQLTERKKAYAFYGLTIVK